LKNINYERKINFNADGHSILIQRSRSKTRKKEEEEEIKKSNVFVRILLFCIHIESAEYVHSFIPLTDIWLVVRHPAVNKTRIFEQCSSSVVYTYILSKANLLS